MHKTALRKWIVLNRNKRLAETIKNSKHNYFDYEMWQTDHPFSNRRIWLMNKVLEFPGQ